MNEPPAAVLAAALDEDRRQALVQQDVDLLRHLVAPDCLWMHASGHVEKGEDYLAGLSAGRFAYQSLSADGIQAAVAGSTVVLTYRQSASMLIEDARHESLARCSAVWALVDDRVRLLAFQSTPIRS